MSIVGNSVVLGAGGESASIFITGLNETDTVIATKGGRAIAGKWVHKPNPAIIVPDGYTQLEYIESTGTQYIDTGFAFSQNVGKIDIGFSSFSSGVLVGSYDGTTRSPLIVCASSKFSFQIGENINSTVSADSDYHDVSFSTDNGSAVIQIDGVDKLNPTHSTSIKTATTSSLFALHRTDGGNSYTEHASAKLYYAKYYDGSDFARHFIPAKRNSDSAIGLYDIVNDVFYENNGTGEFVSGPEIPQYFNGFEVSPIKEYGTWTVDATDGTSTASTEVLVDSAIEYQINMEYKLYLYNLGDDCAKVTGGWNPYSYRPNGVSYNGHTPSVNPKDTSILVSQDNVFEKWGTLFAENLIDLTKYASLNIHVIRSASHANNSGWNGSTSMRIMVPSKKADLYEYLSSAAITSTSTAKVVKTDFTITCDVSSLTGNNYVAIMIAGFSSTNEGNLEFDRIWLE